MKIRTQLLSGFLILILIFLIDFFVNLRLSKEVIRNTTYISISETVIRNSNMLHKNMIDMQSAFRGYLLTSQESFLGPYHAGLKEVPGLIKEQRMLTVSPVQHMKLDSVEHIHERWIQYANQLISTKKDTLPEASKRYQELFETKLKMEVGKKMNDEIRNYFLDFDSYEYAVRKTRRADLQESIERTRRITIALTIISISLALLSSMFIVRTITRRISGMVALAQEISKGNFKTIEDNKQDELKELSQSLNTMSRILDKNFRELTRKNMELDQFAYVVSHDLKAPLRGIDNITRWIEEDHDAELSPDVRKNLEMIKGRTRRLENMINGLLDYARIGRVKKGFEKVDVAIILRELIELLVPAGFIVSIEGDMPVIYTEKLHIEQVFSNLISNAVKYSNKAVGTIRISSRELKDEFEFTVSDDGPGIPAQYHAKIFMIFQTLQERDAFESTGVGLAIVKKIIEDQRATIQVESETGKGTSFIFTWPKMPPNK